MPRIARPNTATATVPSAKTNIRKKKTASTPKRPTSGKEMWTVLRTGDGWVPCEEIQMRAMEVARLRPGQDLALTDTHKERLVLKCDPQWKFSLVLYEKSGNKLEVKRASLVSWHDPKECSGKAWVCQHVRRVA